MVNFSDLPQDVLLNCMYELDVNDIICAERTCTRVRDVVANRHLWLVKLHGLDICCAPDLPPHVDLNDLGYEELRDIVVRASRAYHLMTKGPLPTAEYKLSKTVVVARPKYHKELVIKSVKIAPGCRYLFMQCAGDRYNELRLIDLEKEATCVWLLDFGDIHESLRDSRSRLEYEFEIHSDSSITIFLAICKFRDSKWSLKVLRISATSLSCTRLTSTLLFESESNISNGPRLAMSGNFAAYGLGDGLISIMDWEGKKVTRIQVPIEPSHFPWMPRGPWMLRIWHDHLFYVEAVSSRRRLCSFSLVQAMSLSTSSYSGSVNLTAAGISYLESEIQENGDYHHVAQTVQFSIFDYPWRCDQQTAVVQTVSVTRESLPTPHFISTRAIFDRSQPVPAKWTLISSHSTPYPCGDDGLRHSLMIQSGLSHSGRLLIRAALYRQTNGIDFHLIAIDREGNLIFPRLSENVASNWNDSDVLVGYIEPYSGTLVRLLKGGFGKQKCFVELYSPA